MLPWACPQTSSHLPEHTVTSHTAAFRHTTRTTRGYREAGAAPESCHCGQCTRASLGSSLPLGQDTGKLPHSGTLLEPSPLPSPRLPSPHFCPTCSVSVSLSPLSSSLISKQTCWDRKARRCCPPRINLVGRRGLGQGTLLWSCWSVENPHLSLLCPFPTRALEGVGWQHRHKPYLSLLVWFK